MNTTEEIRAIEEKLNKEYSEIGKITIKKISKTVLKPTEIDYVNSIMNHVKPLDSNEPIILGKDWDGVNLIDGYHRLKNHLLKGTDVEVIILEQYSIDRKSDTLYEFISSLVGKKICFIDSYTIKVDDHIYHIQANEGCGGCDNGWSSLKVLPEFLNKSLKVKKVGSVEGSYEDLYDLYINDKLIANVNTGWGNGYYGGDFSIRF